MCPHFHAGNITWHGTYRGRKRYKCKQSKKIFNDFRDTAIFGIKKVEKFQEYIKHHTFLAYRQDIKTKCYHLQHVNSNAIKDYRNIEMEYAKLDILHCFTTQPIFLSILNYL